MSDGTRVRVAEHELERAVERRTREKIIERIRDIQLSWGHHNAPGCAICMAVRMLIEELEHFAT